MRRNEIFGPVVVTVGDQKRFYTAQERNVQKWFSAARCTGHCTQIITPTLLCPHRRHLASPCPKAPHDSRLCYTSLSQVRTRRLLRHSHDQTPSGSLCWVEHPYLISSEQGCGRCSGGWSSINSLLCSRFATGCAESNARKHCNGSDVFWPTTSDVAISYEHQHGLTFSQQVVYRLRRTMPADISLSGQHALSIHKNGCGHSALG